MSFKELRTEYNITQTRMSELTGIPVRTIQNWEGGQRQCPEYIKDLVAFYLEKTLNK